MIAPDFRGHGDSDWVSDGDYSPTDLVYDIATIFDALKLPPCHVIGHSLGGNIVTRFAGLFPDRVSKLVNIEGLRLALRPGAAEDMSWQLDRLRSWIVHYGKTSGRQPRRYPDLAGALARMRETNGRISEALVRHLVVEGTRSHADGSVTFKYDPGFMTPAAVDLPPQARLPLWGAVTCPLLAIYGADNGEDNPQNDGRLDYFRDARLIIFERAGHWVHHDRQEEVIAAIRGFFAE